jgi:hypothetical protein
LFYCLLIDRFVANVRRDGGIKRMEPSLIEERLRLYKQAQMVKYQNLGKLITNLNISEFYEDEPTFVGREREFNEIDGFLKRYRGVCRVVTIFGGLATGKSALAHSLYRRYGGNNSDANVDIDLCGENRQKLHPVEAMSFNI